MTLVNNHFVTYFALLITCLLLQACGSHSSKGSSNGVSNGKYGYGDGPPPKDIDVSHIPNAVPKVEPIRRAGNKNPYTQFGKTYWILPTSLGYQERGIASWYGNKFHGRNTANGEVYSMYAMTAAHKTLPIPCYVKVTNIDNGRSVIVRVNDRGPFHGNRIIDLSYAAAKKLGYYKQGVANVEVEALDPKTYNQNLGQIDQADVVKEGAVNSKIAPIDKISTDKTPTDKTPVNPAVKTTAQEVQTQETQTPIADTAKVNTDSAEDDQLPANTYLQIGAFNSALAAETLSQRVEGLSPYLVVVREEKQPNRLFKVLIGPVKNHLKLLDLRNVLRQKENLTGFVVYE